MTCRESGLTSAATTIARCMTGLEDRQILSLSHRLQTEFGSENGGVPPTSEEWNAYISEMVNQLSRRELYITPGSSNPIPRLERARHQTPSRERFEASRRILAVATAAQRRQEEFFQQTDRSTGAADGTAAARFRVLSEDPSTPVPPREWRERFLTQATMPTDTRSMAAYYAMGYNVDSDTTATYPVVRRQAVEGSSFLLEEGYDPASGRFEIVMRSHPDRVYAYRLPENVYREFSSASSPGSYYSRNIRGNRAYQYSTAAESTAAGVATRCGTCGQFENAAAHACPVTGSPEAQEHDVQRIVAQRRGTPPPAAPLFLPSRLPHSSYSFSGRRLGVFNMPSSSTVQTNIPVGSEAYMFVSATGMSGEGNVRGYVQVRRVSENEWTAAIPTSSLGRGRQVLSCSCPSYRRNRTCVHVTAVANAVETKLVSPEYSTERLEMIQRAAERAQQLADANVTSITHANWQPPRSSFSEDTTIFQSFYAAAKTAFTAYQSDPENNPFPVPYYEGKAFGGVGSRETGRGFGIEIEYDFPDSMSYADRRQANVSIGRALHQAGLTPAAGQRGYGATHGQTRYNHQGGWSFESDPTTSGEIVSPICYDEAETWESIKKVTDILAEHGAVASQRCGMHIHVGTKDYDSSIDKYTRLMKTVKENEDLLYRMSANPKRGAHRGTGYCRPNAETVPSRYRTMTDMRYHHSGHHLSMNLQSVTGRSSDNVEFRTFDASLEPGVIQAQIGLALYMTEGAHRADLPMPTEVHPLGEKRGRSRRDQEPLRGEAWKNSTAEVRKFIDRFLPGTTENDSENPQIRQFVSLFAISKWQRGTVR